jgi:hypothetical protein
MPGTRPGMTLRGRDDVHATRLPMSYFSMNRPEAIRGKCATGQL